MMTSSQQPAASKELPLQTTGSFEVGRNSFDRWQPRWAWPVAHRTGHRHIRELLSRTHASQQQSSAAHVPSADEINREQQAIAEDSGQHLDILRRGNAAEQDHLAL